MRIEKRSQIIKFRWNTEGSFFWIILSKYLTFTFLLYKNSKGNPLQTGSLYFFLQNTHPFFIPFCILSGHDSQRTVFRYAQKACGKDFYGEQLLFLIKIFNFHQKQQLLSNRFFSMPSSMSILSSHACSTYIFTDLRIFYTRHTIR